MPQPYKVLINAVMCYFLGLTASQFIVAIGHRINCVIKG